MNVLRDQRLEDQTGSVMAITLFMIFAISIFALAASTIVSGDLFQSKRYQNNIQASFLARAGIEKAIQTLLHDNPDFDSLHDSWSNNSDTFKEIALDNGFFSVNYETCNQKIYGIVDEESKININTASRDMLLMLEYLDTDKVEIILKSRKKAIFQNPSELVLRGIISNEEFTGQKGLRNSVTVWGKGKININTASREVLFAVPGFNAKEVDAILSFRHGADGIPGTFDDGVFKSINELKNLSGIKSKVNKNMFTVKSNNFYIFSEGFISKRKQLGKRVIAAVVRRNQGKISILHWDML